MTSVCRRIGSPRMRLSGASWSGRYQASSNVACATSWILPRLWPILLTSSQLPCGSTIRHHTRLSKAVPHSTAFLPPAFIAMLPPMHDASSEVGSTANASPARSAASVTRRVTTPACEKIVATSCATPASGACSTGDSRSSFSVFTIADMAVSGTAPPV